MRTTAEIVDAVQEQRPATEAELRLALLAIYYHGRLGNNTRTPAGKAAFESHFRMIKATLRDYLGDRWTPGTDENGKARSAAFAVLDRVLKRGEKGYDK